MLFVKTIALALLVSTARSIPMPEPEPNPQTVPYTQASSQALAVWSENTCSNFETYHNELDADYQVVIGDFNEEANSLASNFQNVVGNFDRSMNQAQGACNQISAMLEAVAQTFDSGNGITCGDFCEDSVIVWSRPPLARLIWL